MITKTELRIFSVHLMFSVFDEPSQHLQRLKSKCFLLCMAPIPDRSAVAAVLLRVMGEILSEKLKCSTTVASLLLCLWSPPCSCARLVYHPTPHNICFPFVPRRCCRHTLGEKAKTLLLRVSAPEELLRLSLFLRDPRSLAVCTSSINISWDAGRRSKRHSAVVLL